MKILALEEELPGLQAEACQPHLAAEARRVWDLQQSGQLREIYFRFDRHTAVLMLECADLAEAEAILATLPLVANGLIRFNLVPLAPYSGFARLFSNG